MYDVEKALPDISQLDGPVLDATWRDWARKEEIKRQDDDPTHTNNQC